MCIMLMMSKRRSSLIQPSSLANRILHLDANTTFSGSAHDAPVSSWTDLSGNGYDLSADVGLRPLVQKTSNLSPNGKVLVRFDGTDDGLSRSTPNPWPTDTSGYTFYFYGKFRETTAPPAFFAIAQLFADNSTNLPQIGYEKNPSSHPYVVGNNPLTDLHSANIFDTKMQFLAVVFQTNGKVQAYRAQSGGDLQTLDQNPTQSVVPLSRQGISMGIALSGNGACNMDLATVVWCNEAHTTTTINGVRNALKATYGED